MPPFLVAETQYISKSLEINDTCHFKCLAQSLALIWKSLIFVILARLKKVTVQSLLFSVLFILLSLIVQCSWEFFISQECECLCLLSNKSEIPFRSRIIYYVHVIGAGHKVKGAVQSQCWTQTGRKKVQDITTTPSPPLFSQNNDRQRCLMKNKLEECS